MDQGLDLPFGTGAQPAPQQDAAAEWGNWLKEPANRAAIMQLGVSLMQPVGIGQTPAGAFGQALGSAGEAVDRVQTQQRLDEEQSRKGRETDSRIDAREAAASNAETRANAAMVGANARAAMTESSIALNRARADAAYARVQFLEQRTQQLAQLVAAEPANMEAKRALNEARALTEEARRNLYIEQAGAVGRNLDIRQQRADTQRDNVNSQIENRSTTAATAQQRANTAERDVNSRITTREGQLDVNRANAATQRQGAEDRRTGQGLTDMARQQKLYLDEVKAIQKRNSDARLMDPKAKPEPIPTYSDWKKQFQSAPAQPQAAPAPAPAPSQPQPISAQPQSQAPTAVDANGNRVRWNGSMWVPM